MKPTKEEMLEVIYSRVSDGLLNCITIGNILDYLDNQQSGEYTKFEQNSQFQQIQLHILELWERKTIWINQQSSKLIEYIYNLVK